MKRTVWLFVVGYVLFAVLSAQATRGMAVQVSKPDPVLETWRWQFFTENDGLASVRVRGIVQARDAIWFATGRGVSRYDGMAWETYTRAEGLADNDVRAVVEGVDGAIWFGTASGVCRFDGRRWETFDRGSGLPGDSVRDLLATEDGEIWAATDEGAALMNGKGWHAYTEDHELADKRVKDLAVGPDGAVWFATERGASRFDGVSWQSFRRGDGLKGTSVTSVFADRDGALWFAQYGVGLSLLKDGVWSFYGTGNGLPDRQVRQVFQTPDGAIWVICRSGIARVEGAANGGKGMRWTAYNRKTLSGLGEPHTAAVDAQGAVWIGGPSSRGVARFNYAGKRLAVFHLEDVVNTARGNGVGQDRDGSIWFGVDKGALCYDGTAWSLVDELNGPVRNIFTDTNGVLYLMGRDNRGPAVLRVQGMARKLMQAGLLKPTGETVRVMDRTRDGSLWAGVPGGGLYRWPQGSEAWEKQPENDRVPGRIFAMSASGDGSLWVAGRGVDLSRWTRGNRWTPMGVPGTREVQKLRATPDGSMWIAFGMAGGGVMRLNLEGKTRTYTVLDGLVHDEVHALVVGPGGALWAGTSGGVARFDGQTWTPLRDVPDLDVRALFVARDGAIWMRTADGDAVRYWNDGEAPKTVLVNPPTHVSSEGNVSFVWEGQDLWAPASAPLEYSFRVDEEPWAPFVDRTRATLTSLSDGTHTFEVRARDADLNVEAATVSHRFEVEPPLWKRPWFLAVIGLLLTAVVVQTRRILVRDQELASANDRLQELDQVKTDFFSNVSHELRTPLTVIKAAVDNMLDGIGGEITERQERSLNRVKSNADRLHRHINDLLDLSRVDRGRTDMLQLNMEKVMAREVVGEVVEDMRLTAEAERLQLTFEGKDGYAMADRDRLKQMVVNLVSNAIKFTASGGEVSVNVRPDGTGYIQTIVKDTGKGIPKEDLGLVFERFRQVKGTFGGSGLGLPITKELVEQHGGKIWVESEEGVGSTFTFTVPEAKD